MSSTGDNIGSNNDSSTDSHAIILPTPVAVHGVESRIVVFTKFFSWLTATLLAIAVIISLVSVTSERNDLRHQLAAQSTELACRSAAAIEVNKVVAARDNTIAKALASLAQGTPLTDMVPLLEEQTLAVDAAIAAQQTALEACDKS